MEPLRIVSLENPRQVQKCRTLCHGSLMGNSAESLLHHGAKVLLHTFESRHFCLSIHHSEPQISGRDLELLKSQIKLN